MATTVNTITGLKNSFSISVTLPMVIPVWYLPSTGELGEMISVIELVGEYWSSTEISAINALTLLDSGGPIPDTYSKAKSLSYKVRACRKFTATAGTYSVGDVGPCGGLIFYISGTTYYEAAPSDQSLAQAWSNVTLTAIGTTSSVIGEGQNNTNEIIAQSGHTDSAAKLCDDYIR